MMGFISKLFRSEQKQKRPYCSAVVAAGGASARFGGNKLFVPLNDMPVIAYSLLNLEKCPDIDEVIVAARQEDIFTVSDICSQYGIRKVKKVVSGGATRVKSVLAGISEISKDAELIAIHDAARPFASPELISAVVRRAAECGACAPAISVIDTIKVCKEDRIVSTPDRKTLYAVQTPQVFEASLIKAALISADRNGMEITDDCAAVEQYGKAVYIVEGDCANIKITMPQDLGFMQCMLEGGDV